MGLELILLAGYVGWLEACSHSGKPMPASNMVALIAPIYHAILGDLDRRNVEFHQTHHEVLRCNYSITQWPDHLVGTTQWKQRPEAAHGDLRSISSGRSLESPAGEAK